METALKRYFSQLRAFAPLQYVDTAAVATAQIHRKIPILRCSQFSRAQKTLNERIAAQEYRPYCKRKACTVWGFSAVKT